MSSCKFLRGADSVEDPFTHTQLFVFSFAAYLSNIFMGFFHTASQAPPWALMCKMMLGLTKRM
jgi:hypothetical protein